MVRVVPSNEGQGLLGNGFESSSDPEPRNLSSATFEILNNEPASTSSPEASEAGFPRSDSSKLRGKSFMQQAKSLNTLYRVLQEHTEHMYKNPKGLFDPRKRSMQRWDLVIAILLLFTAVVTPFEVAFIDTDEFYDPLFIINRIVDLCFCIDMLIQFNLMYLDNKTNSWVTGRKRIAKNYLLGSFIIDFVSILPFDTIGMIMGDGSVKKLKIFRIVRLMRLFKLLRVIRSGRIFRRLEEMLNLGYAMLTLLKFVLGTLAIAHWMACAWKLVVVIEGSCENWIILYFNDREDGENYCDPIPLEVCLNPDPEQAYGSLTASCLPEGLLMSDASFCADGCGSWHQHMLTHEFLGLSVFHLFVTSFYWSLVTMSTIGYGDVLPNTAAERVFAIFAMIFGTSVFAYVVGSVCGIVAKLDKKSTTFYDLMDDLATFGKENQIEDKLNDRLKSYFRYRAQYTAMADWADLLRLMSPALRGEVAMLKCGGWVTGVPYFSEAPSDFIVEVAMRLGSATFPQWEEILHLNDHADRMYIVERGIVGCKGRVIVRGRVIGADLMLTGYPSDYKARALTYTDLFVLKRKDMRLVSEKYPAVQLAMRKAACKEICRRQTLGFMRVWNEIAQGQLIRRDHVTRSSFQQVGMGKNETENAKWQRESYLRDVAVEISQLPRGPGDSPAFPVLDSAEMHDLLMDEAREETENQPLDPTAKIQQTLDKVSEEQDNLKQELAAMSRMVQQLVAKMAQTE